MVCLRPAMDMFLQRNTWLFCSERRMSLALRLPLPGRECPLPRSATAAVGIVGLVVEVQLCFSVLLI